MQDAILSLNRMRELLQIEYEEEKNSFHTLADKIGISRLVDRGNAWYPVSVASTRYNSLDQRVVEIEREPVEDSDHNFEYGRPVVFFTLSGAGGEKPYRLFPGMVSYVDGDRMVVAVSDGADISRLSSGDPAGVMLSFDETTYRAMFEAIDNTMKAKGRLAELRDLIYSNRKFGNLSLPPMRFPYLNVSQQEAVNKVLCAKDVAIVHGPPGTGKTTTLVEAIYETLRREPQVMVCAQSNMAVDWISEKLTDRGINVLRIGNPSRVNDKMLSFTYERRFESHPAYSDLWAVRNAIRQLYAGNKRGDAWHQKIERLKERATELELRINNDLFNEARVVACTLVGSSSRILTGMKFPTLFIDEAAQALEAACWIPARRAGRIILAGDHCQLPATVKSYEALKRGLGKSLMERIVETHPECVTLLTMQYRMHREIMAFPNQEFYDGRMTAAPEVAYRGILDLDTPVQWIDTSSLPSVLSSPGPDQDNSTSVNLSPDRDSEHLPASELEMEFRESIAGAGMGRVNHAEAALTVATLADYIETIGVGRFLEERIDVGVISPYRAQVRYLRTLIRKEPRLRRVRNLISVNTVDGFQGQERDMIVLSLVRSNEKGDIGFLRDLRRINVAMTRAKMKLIIIGDAATLCRHPFYRRLKSHIDSSGD